MMRQISGIPLFRAFGIQVYLHWSWFLVAFIELQNPIHQYSSRGWNVLEYITLFAIVLIHEFGHALACRSVGGRAEQITLWPLGGVAFVDPPQRPGAVLWSVFAGPLVNIVLVPVTILLAHFAPANTDLGDFAHAVMWINASLLIFNMLPIYPLDGGQIFRSILWYFIGPGRSLMVASIVGLVGAACGCVLALLSGDVWLLAVAGFAAMLSWNGWNYSRRLRLIEDLTPRTDVNCPHCHASPPSAMRLQCQNCNSRFDPFATDGVCPHCRAYYPAISCPSCRQLSAPQVWRPGAVVSS